MTVLTGQDICAGAKITYRQMDTWIRRGWLPNPPQENGSGSRRTFNEDHLAFFKTMSTLVSAGVYPEKAQQLAKGNVKAITRLVLALADCPGGVVTWRPLPPVGSAGARSPETGSAEPCG